MGYHSMDDAEMISRSLSRSMNDVNINWNPEVLKARNYQVNLIKKNL